MRRSLAKTPFAPQCEGRLQCERLNAGCRGWGTFLEVAKSFEAGITEQWFLRIAKASKAVSDVSAGRQL